ncbi:MAG: STAS domain-containing protein [Bacteroidaceae bacterium]|nr:STAS domain-containing protein [Bacteroidaceae bacterium]
MEVKINKDGAKTIVELTGRLDTTNANQFQADIQSLLNDENPDIELDCTNMEYTSSQGLRIFLMLQKSVNQHKGKMVMKNMKSQVKEVFDITGFSSIINIL